MRTVAAKTAQVSIGAHSLYMFLDGRVGPVGLSVCRVEVFSGTRVAGVRHEYCRSRQVFRQGATCDNTAAASADRDHTLIGASV
jgi:hypothetical protein